MQRKSFGKIPFPQLSLGATLLTLDELRVQLEELNALQNRAFQDLNRAFERSLRKRRVSLEQKAEREIITRTNLWRAYIMDLEEDPDSVDEYEQQVRNRVLMTRLSDFAPPNQSEGLFEGFRKLDERVLLTAMSSFLQLLRQ